MLSLPIYFRNSTYYLHTRVFGKQVKRSLHTADKQTAIIRASKLMESVQVAIDLNKFTKYELDIAKGIARADSPEDHQRLLETMQLMAVLKNSSKATDTQQASNKAPEPPAESLASSTEEGLTFLQLLDKFLLFKKVREATVVAYKQAAEEFAAHYGKRKKITALLKSDITRFQEKLLQKGNTIRTVDKKVGIIKTLLFFAIQQGYYFGENPASNRDLMTKKQKLTEGHEHFEEDEIRKIYQSQFLATAKIEDPDYYWALVLALFTGCRVSEITSLTAEQFKKSDEGNHYIKLFDAKTQKGKREIPLPECLFKDGLKDFIPETGQLFKYQTRDGKGSGNAVSKKFKRHLEELTITRPKLVFHSLRKFTNDYFLKQDVPFEPRCQFFGHEVGNINVATYAKKFSIDQLARIVSPAQQMLVRKFYRILKL